MYPPSPVGRPAVLADWALRSSRSSAAARGRSMPGNLRTGCPTRNVGSRSCGEQFNAAAVHRARCSSDDATPCWWTSSVRRTCSSRTSYRAPPPVSGRRDDLLAVNERYHARASGHGDRGPEREAGGFRPHRLWLEGKIAQWRQPGVRRVRAAGRAGARDSRRGASWRRVGRCPRGARSGPDGRRGRTSRFRHRACGVRAGPCWPAASTASTRFPRMRHADLPNPLVAA